MPPEMVSYWAPGQLGTAISGTAWKAWLKNAGFRYLITFIIAVPCYIFPAVGIRAVVGLWEFSRGRDLRRGDTYTVFFSMGEGEALICERLSTRGEERWLVIESCKRLTKRIFHIMKLLGDWLDQIGTKKFMDNAHFGLVNLLFTT